jgi:molybdopterin-guanine dinucleotide biosynthesis protein A
MGRDKALLPWRGSTLLDHAVARLRAACGSVRLLPGREGRYATRGLPQDPDVWTNAGALGAVHTGLLSLPSGRGVFLAVDLPRVPAALLQRLLAHSLGYDAVVPVTAAGPEPLCAVYAASCREAIRRRIEGGQMKMTSFWPDVRVREVRAQEIRDLGDPELLFSNVNSPEDWVALREP